MIFDAWKRLRRVILREGLSSKTAQLKTIIKDRLEGPANLECHQRLLIWSSHYLHLHTCPTWSWQLFCWLVCCLGIVVWESCYDYGTQSQTKYLTDPGMNFNLRPWLFGVLLVASPWPLKPWILWCYMERGRSILRILPVHEVRGLSISNINESFIRKRNIYVFGQILIFMQYIDIK